MATEKQVRYIKLLVKTGHVVTGNLVVAKCLLDVLGSKNVSVKEASMVIDALLQSQPNVKVVHTFDPKPVQPTLWEEEIHMQGTWADKPTANRTTKPVSWLSPAVTALLQAVNDGRVRAEDAAKSLNTKEAYVIVRAKLLKEHGVASLPDKTGGAKSFGAILSDKEFNGSEIKWAKFLELDREERFDLRVICSMFYASERIASFRGEMPAHVRSEFSTMKERAQAYVDLWAERFAKYALAACLGEFRHRRRHTKEVTGNLSRRVTRAAAQGAAMVIWPDRDKTVRITKHMAETFSSTVFPRSGFGGRPWARIASTLLSWLEGKIPNIVWGDYVWDLSHNGGRFFDKCNLFQNEQETRRYLDAKKASKDGNLKWATPMLHEDWKSGVDMVEFAKEAE